MTAVCYIIGFAVVCGIIALLVRKWRSGSTTTTGGIDHGVDGNGNPTP